VKADAPDIRMPVLTETLTAVWHLLFDLAEQLPDTWCLIGGLMVALYGVEHGRTGIRPTADGDVLVDTRAEPSALRRMSNFLIANNLDPDPAPDGILHRFKGTIHADEIVIDVLAPDHLGLRADLTTRPGGRTIEVPGGTQALSRAEYVEVHVGDRTGRIQRPNLVGAIIVKLAALELPGDSDRHLQDLTFLFSLMPDPLASRSTLTRPERRKLGACALTDRNHRAWNWLTNEDADAGHAALRLLSDS
jgi:hypothetical protein